MARTGKSKGKDARPPAADPTPADFVAFARKYRPQRFDEVVGQEAVGRTLRGALRAGRVPAAFLFAGPRGVGKTTMARILAKALNCDAADGPTPDPCGTCATCVTIARGAALDVIEVDAASHNGVDDVREIRERVAHLPASGRCKVYILDEAHMFSNAAWNAFLKTLEEPPAHARFVFATTEPEKVPETIVSRCQRFDFRRIRTDDIVTTLRTIVEREGAARGTPLDVEDAALVTLARFARGGLRDAESLLEQAVLAGEGLVREEDLAALLGTVPREMVQAVLAAAAAGDADGVLSAYARVHAAGADAATFLGQALALLRDVTVVAVAGSGSGLVEGEEGERAALADLAGALGRAGALRATQALAETLRLVRATDEERPLVEAGLLRIALAGPAAGLGEVLDALAAMEARLGGGGGPDPASAAPPAPRGAVAAPGAEPRRTTAREAASPPPATPPDRALFRGAEPSPVDGEPLDLDRVREQWSAVLDAAKGRLPALGTFLAAANPTVLTDDALTLEFPPRMGFHRSQCEEPERKAALEECLGAVFGRPLRAKFDTGADDGEDPEEERPGRPVRPADFDRLRHDEIEGLAETDAVRALGRHFDVDLVRARRREPDPPADDEGVPGAPEEDES